MALFHRQAAGNEVIESPLPQYAGYIVVIVLGFLIAFVMLFVTKILKQKLGGDNRSSEMFMVTNRSISTGLTASAVISSWL